MDGEMDTPEKGILRTPKSPRIKYHTTDEMDYYPTKDLPPGEARLKRPGRDFLRHDSLKYDLANLNAEKDLSPAPGRVMSPSPGRAMSPSPGRAMSPSPGRAMSPSPGRAMSSSPGRALYSLEYPVRDTDDRVQSVASDQQDYRSTISSSRPLVDTLDRSTLSSRFDPTYATPKLAKTEMNRSILSVRERMEAISKKNEHNRSILSNTPQSPHSFQSPHSPHSPISPPPYGGFNRSILSNDINRSILSTHTDGNRSTTSRADFYDSATNHSILSNTSKVPAHHQNGFLKPIVENKLSQSRKSLNFSDGGLNSTKVTLYGSKDFGVRNSLVNLGLVCILSLVLAVIGLQLMFRLNTQNLALVSPNTLRNSLLGDNKSYASTLEVAVGLTSFVIMFDLVCLLVCAFQLYFAAKLMKCPQGDERTFKFLKECASTRFIAIAAFFLSIPILLLAILLYTILEFHATASIISTVILTGGISYVIATVIHSVYVWRVEKGKADMNVPPFEKKYAPENLTQALNQSELSTLV